MGIFVSGSSTPRIDSIPTQNSDNLITSGGVYNALLDGSSDGIDVSKYYWYRRSYEYSYNTSSSDRKYLGANAGTNASYRLTVTYEVSASLSFDETSGEVTMINSQEVTWGNSGDISRNGDWSGGRYFRYKSHTGSGYPSSASYYFHNTDKIFYTPGPVTSYVMSGTTYTMYEAPNVIEINESVLTISGDEEIVKDSTLSTYPNNSDFTIVPNYYPYVYKYIGCGIDLQIDSCNPTSYYWKRRSYHYDSEIAYSSTSNFKLSYSYGSSSSSAYKNNVFNVSDSISFNPIDGTYSLVNPIEVTWGSSNGDSIDTIGNWSGGKYIQYVRSIGTSSSGTCPAESYPDSIFHVDGPVTVSGSWGAGYYYYAGQYQRYDTVTTPTIMGDEVVIDSNISTTYPNNGEFTVVADYYPYIYKYIGAGLNNTGSWKTLKSYGIDATTPATTTNSVSSVYPLNISEDLSKISKMVSAVRIRLVCDEFSVGGYTSTSNRYAQVYLYSQSESSSTSGYTVTYYRTVSNPSTGTHVQNSLSSVIYDRLTYRYGTRYFTTFYYPYLNSSPTMEESILYTTDSNYTRLCVYGYGTYSVHFKGTLYIDVQY